MCYLITKRERGFTLIELLIAMTIGLVLMGAMSSLFLTQRRSYDMQEQKACMSQTVRAAMDMMTREIRMAGYCDPSATNFVGIPYNANSSTIDVYADLDGDGNIDTTTAGTFEHITYSYDSTTLQIRRNTNITGDGYDDEPFAENIELLKFVYRDENGNDSESNSIPTADIRQIKITIIARTAKPDPNYPQNQGYRQYTLTSVVTPRNLAY